MNENQKEIENNAFKTVIATLKHEINNPLSIAVCHLSLLLRKSPDDPSLLATQKALDRIADLVKSLDHSIEMHTTEEVEYGHGHKILKINRAGK